ncbi:universal stress protein [Oceanobacillus halotolerans]|uniref:universal stress protein n=1 Tax=Oceanobacillus halotolerans TaxID=2663380 RepID=UPI0013DC1786|nr:universal stress protein [Oceanobacillus halotolerans]
MFTKILLATDGSDHSVRSTHYATELAEKFGATIGVVYVVDGSTSKTDVLHHTDKFEVKKKRKEKIKKVEDVLQNTGIEYEIHILHGEPGPTIVSFANKNEFDCVVIGSRGLNEFQTFILGSVSHKVAKRVNCPVLIVK